MPFFDLPPTIAGRLRDRDIPALLKHVAAVACDDERFVEWGEPVIRSYGESNPDRVLAASELGRAMYYADKIDEPPVGFFSAMLLRDSDALRLWNSSSNEEFWLAAQAMPSLCKACIDPETRPEPVQVFISHCFWNNEAVVNGEAYIDRSVEYVMRWFAGYEPSAIMFSEFKRHGRFVSQAKDYLLGISERKLQHSFFVKRLRLPAHLPQYFLAHLRALQYKCPEQGAPVRISEIQPRKRLALRAWYASKCDVRAVAHLLEWATVRDVGGGRVAHDPKRCRELEKALSDFVQHESTKALALAMPLDFSDRRDERVIASSRIWKVMQEHPHLLLEPSMHTRWSRRDGLLQPASREVAGCTCRTQSEARKGR